MARRSRQDSPENLRVELVALLECFKDKLNDENLRSQVRALIPANHKLRDLGSSLIYEEDVQSAKERILAYFRKYPATVLHGDELMVVAGISEYARRIRELRVEAGWPILSGSALRQTEIELNEDDGKIVKTDTYFLIEDEQDRDSAYRWNMANTIRRSAGSVKDKILQYLRANVGKKVTGEEIMYLASGRSEWARRIRELRTEEGWPVMTRASGRPDLSIGIYMLEEDRQAEKHDRKIPDPVRVAVLERDTFRCRCCGWSHATKQGADRYRSMLELHHIIYHVDGGENVIENLITLCNVCHDQVHREAISKEVLLSYINTNI